MAAGIPRSRTTLLLTLDAFNTVFYPREHVAVQYAQVAKAAGFLSPSVPPAAVQAAFKKAYKQESALRPNYGRNTPGFGGPRQWWSNVIRSCFAQVREDTNGVNYGPGPVRRPAVPDSLVAELIQRFEGKEGYAPFEDVQSFFNRLKAWKTDLNENSGKDKRHGDNGIDRVVVGVISNSDDRIAQIFRSLGLSVGNAWADTGELLPHQAPTTVGIELNDIDFVVTSYEAGEEKPHPRIFEIAQFRAKEHLVATDPSYEPRHNKWRRIHIGDDYGDDYEGAINSGWEGFLLLRREWDYLSGTNHQAVGSEVNTLQSLNDLYSKLDMN